jgi:hypothetical protein
MRQVTKHDGLARKKNKKKKIKGKKYIFVEPDLGVFTLLAVSVFPLM